MEKRGRWRVDKESRGLFDREHTSFNLLVSRARESGVESTRRARPGKRSESKGLPSKLLERRCRAQSLNPLPLSSGPETGTPPPHPDLKPGTR